MSLFLAILNYLLLVIVMKHTAHRCTAPIAPPIDEERKTAETSDFRRAA